ncbi:uracil-DNA glycosylase [Xanthomonas citri pv. mangiferaeindicae]|nr:uracil-DNA glycosylase [Xanthomonas citri pv. mangiferaeindicae]
MAVKPTTPASSTWMAKPVDAIPNGALSRLRAEAAQCRACPLWRPATQTVFGRGPASARLVLVGEQPGDREDLAGQPFVGPAGQLLRETLAQVGIDTASVYLTNAVKHFKFVPRGKRRLHQRANASEQAACRPWLAGELERIAPAVVVALGAMAAQTLFGNAFRVSTQRGAWQTLPNGRRALATWHPSALLRMRAPDRAQAEHQFAQDLARVADHLMR